VGKSELALELISRGHSLVADDAPEFSRPAPGVIDGECSELLQDFLEVSGMGVLNIRAMFGDAAIRTGKQLQLIMRMEPLDSQQHADSNRLGGELESTEVLGVAIPTMTLPVAPGRNLAVMVEAAVRNYMLIRRGYRAGDDLIERQRSAIARDQSCD
jgi:HPr kinase/phosphorylase